MPRIRKKTSNRQNTRDRKKISKHVAEHKKKERKTSKKDVTWKSKKKADPGIPNSFIHKDKVLAEMAAEKRQEEEARLARREAAKGLARAQSPEEEETPGIQSILSATVSSRSKPKAVAEVEVDEEDMDIPNLIDTSLTTLQEVLDKADVVIQVVDARDIAGGRSKFIEDLVKEAGGKIVLLVNKIDRVPKETLQSWLKTISIPTFLFKSVLPVSRASTSTQHIEPTVVLGKTELLEYLSTIKPAEKDADLHVALMGLPNVGKTSVLNSLLPAKAKHHETAPVLALNAASKNPQPTTKMPSETRIEHDGKGIRIIDTPGWDFADDEEEEEEEDEDEDEEDSDVEVDEEKLAKWDKIAETMTGDLLRRNLGRVDRIKDIIPLADFIISRSNAQDLMVAYNIPYFNDGDTMAFLTAVARSTGRLRKHNSPDLESAAKHLVRDWAQNTFPYYSTPKASGASSMEVDNVAQPDMSAVLEKCSSRKDMRKVGKGVIRFKGGEVDVREIVLNDDYTAGLAPSDDEDEDEDDEEDDEDVEDDDEDDDEELEVDDLDSDEEVIEGADFEVESASDGEEEEEEVSEPEPEPVSRKLKRKADPVASPGEKKKPRTHKRVSFGGKLGATGSSETVEKEVKSILKRDRNGDVKAAATVVKEAAPAKKAVAAAAAVKEAAPVKKAAPVAASNGKAKKTKGTYDFSAHF